MRVVHVISEMSRGGAASVLLDLARELPRLGCEMDVICLGPESPGVAEIEARGVSVDCLGKSSRYQLGILRCLRELIQEKKPQLVHTHVFGAGVWTRICCGLQRDWACVVHEHSTWAYGCPQRALLSWCLSGRADVLIAVSQEIGRLACRWGMPRERVRVIPNGISSTAFADMPEMRRKARLSRRVEERPPGILAVGALEPRKGFDLLIRAAGMLLRESRILELEIVGDGPLRKELDAQIQGLQLAPVAGRPPIRLVGEVADVRPPLAQATFYVSASRTEGTSIALLEAMSAGVPVIATAVGGTLDLAAGARRMYLVPPEDVQALAGAMRAFLEMPGVGEVLAEKARADVQALFTSQARAEAVVGVYRDLLAGAAPAGA